MRTQKYIDNQSQLINQSLTAIDDLQRQLDELKQQVRVSQQLHQAQSTAQTELSKWLQQGKKLLKDCSGVFPSEFLDDIVDEVMELTEEIKNDYDNFSQSDRFLNSDTQDQQDNNQQEKPAAAEYSDYQLLLEVEDKLPSEDNDITALTTKQVESIINRLDKPIIDKIKGLLGINSRLSKLDSIADAIADKGITHKKLRELINLAESERLLLSGFNGNGNGKS